MRKAGCVLFLLPLGFSLCSYSQSGGAESVPASVPSQPRPIFLDVVVTDNSGKPVPDLEPFDLSLQDENQPRKILGFRRTDGTAGSKMDPPVEVIIVLDAVNVPYWAVARIRLEVDRFLHENGGHLAHPVSIYMFTSEGLRVQPAPSTDGNALAEMLDHSTGTVRARDLSGGVYSLQEQFQQSYQTIAGMAENLSHRPGRKIVIWPGTGWPMLTERFFIQTNVSRETYYRQLAALQNKLREARVTLYSLPTNAGFTNRLYEGYLKPVRDIRKMEIADMALPVLAEHTGGQVLDPSNDIRGQLDLCVAEIGEYYTIAFMPPPAAGTDEYHDLKVVVNKPGLTVRTDTGYYNEPAPK